MWGRAGFPGMGTALQSSALSCQGQDYNSSLALAVVRLGREARVGAGGWQAASTPPRAGWAPQGTATCLEHTVMQAGSQGARGSHETWGLGTQWAAVSTLEEQELLTQKRSCWGNIREVARPNPEQRRKVRQAIWNRAWACWGKKKKTTHVLFLQREGHWMKQIPKWRTGLGISHSFPCLQATTSF